MIKNMQKIIARVVLTAFIGTSIQWPAYAQVDLGINVLNMPSPGVRVNLSPEYAPASLRGLVVHPENGLKFDFIIAKGDDVLTDQQKHDTYQKLIKYFLASLAVPDENQWVNLSPYEKDRIIKEDFGKTDMGRDLLTQDYLLKQITASLIYPEEGLGKKFWDTVYQRAYEKFGNTNVPVNTFNKVWIIPDSAEVYEREGMVYVVSQHLKVMLEEDYLALNKNSVIARSPKGDEAISSISSQIIREIVIPALTKEVNEGKNFAMLRQVYSGMILAAWYKQALKESLLGKIYANKAKLKGIDQDPTNNQKVYQQYLKAFKKGVFNYIKEDVDKNTQQPIPRKYFSGGAVRPQYYSQDGRPGIIIPAHLASVSGIETASPSDFATTQLAETPEDAAMITISKDQSIIDLARKIAEALNTAGNIVIHIEHNEQNGVIKDDDAWIKKYIQGDVSVRYIMKHAEENLSDNFLDKKVQQALKKLELEYVTHMYPAYREGEGNGYIMRFIVNCKVKVKGAFDDPIVTIKKLYDKYQQPVPGTLEEAGIPTEELVKRIHEQALTLLGELIQSTSKLSEEARSQKQELSSELVKLADTMKLNKSKAKKKVVKTINTTNTFRKEDLTNALNSVRIAFGHYQLERDCINNIDAWLLRAINEGVEDLELRDSLLTDLRNKILLDTNAQEEVTVADNEKQPLLKDKAMVTAEKDFEGFQQDGQEERRFKRASSLDFAITDLEVTIKSLYVKYKQSFPKNLIETGISEEEVVKRIREQALELLGEVIQNRNLSKEEMVRRQKLSVKLVLLANAIESKKSTKTTKENTFEKKDLIKAFDGIRESFGYGALGQKGIQRDWDRIQKVRIPDAIRKGVLNSKLRDYLLERSLEIEFELHRTEDYMEVRVAANKDQPILTDQAMVTDDVVLRKEILRLRVLFTKSNILFPEELNREGINRKEFIAELRQQALNLMEDILLAQPDDVGKETKSTLAQQLINAANRISRVDNPVSIANEIALLKQMYEENNSAFPDALNDQHLSLEKFVNQLKVEAANNDNQQVELSRSGFGHNQIEAQEYGRIRDALLKVVKRLEDTAQRIEVINNPLNTDNLDPAKVKLERARAEVLKYHKVKKLPRKLKQLDLEGLIREAQNDFDRVSEGVNRGYVEQSSADGVLDFLQKLEQIRDSAMVTDVPYGHRDFIDALEKELVKGDRDVAFQLSYPNASLPLEDKTERLSRLVELFREYATERGEDPLGGNRLDSKVKGGFAITLTGYQKDEAKGGTPTLYMNHSQLFSPAAVVKKEEKKKNREDLVQAEIAQLKQFYQEQGADFPEQLNAEAVSADELSALLLQEALELMGRVLQESVLDEERNKLTQLATQLQETAQRIEAIIQDNNQSNGLVPRDMADQFILSIRKSAEAVAGYDSFSFVKQEHRISLFEVQNDPMDRGQDAAKIFAKDIKKYKQEFLDKLNAEINEMIKSLNVKEQEKLREQLLSLLKFQDRYGTKIDEGRQEYYFLEVLFPDVLQVQRAIEEVMQVDFKRALAVWEKEFKDGEVSLSYRQGDTDARQSDHDHVRMLMVEALKKSMKISYPQANQIVQAFNVQMSFLYQNDNFTNHDFYSTIYSVRITLKQDAAMSAVKSNIVAEIAQLKQFYQQQGADFPEHLNAEAVSADELSALLLQEALELMGRVLQESALDEESKKLTQLVTQLQETARHIETIQRSGKALVNTSTIILKEAWIQKEIFVAPPVFSPDGQFVATIVGSEAVFFNALTGLRIKSFPLQNMLRGGFTGGTMLFRDIHFSPDGKRVLIGGDYGAQVWDFDTNKLLFTVDGRAYSQYSPDGRFILTGNWDLEPGFIWHAENGNNAQEKGYFNVVFSPDSQFVVEYKHLSNRGTIFKANTRERVGDLTIEFQIRTLVYSPDGKRIAVGSSDTTVFDATTRKMIFDIEGINAAYSPDGRFIVTSNYKKELIVWDAKTGKEIGRRQLPYLATSIQFSHDGKFIMTADVNSSYIKSMNLWEIDIIQVVKVGSSIVERGVTRPMGDVAHHFTVVGMDGLKNPSINQSINLLLKSSNNQLTVYNLNLVIIQSVEVLEERGLPVSVEEYRGDDVLVFSEVSDVRTDNDSLIVTVPKGVFTIQATGISFAPDAAMNAKYGGIDFNAANLNLQIKRDVKGVPLPMSQQNLENIKIDGLIPVIIEIKPAMLLPLLAKL